MENVKNINLVYGIAGLIIGILVTSLVYSNNQRGYTNKYGMNGMMHQMNDGQMMQNNMMGMNNAMGSMMAGLQGKTGDAFDKAFIKEMVMHHQGAVAMAQAALVNAKHSEIKTMANAIISAQTSEIGQMKAWLKSWYGEDYQENYY